MSVIEDTRKLIQDFLAPELRSISARLDAFEQRVDDRFRDLAARIDANEGRAGDRFRDLDAKISGQHQQTMLAIASLAN
jgi:hypothetical protein